MKNYYEILNVANCAPFDVVKKGYRRQAMKWHPDRNKNTPESVEMFKMIAEAYSFLSNPDQKKRYDEYLNSSQNKSSKTDQKDSTQDSQYEDKNTNDSSANQIFWEEMIELSFELRRSGMSELEIAQDLINKGCPRDLANALAKASERQQNSNENFNNLRSYMSFSILIIVVFIILFGYLFLDSTISGQNKTQYRDNVNTSILKKVRVYEVEVGGQWYEVNVPSDVTDIDGYLKIAQEKILDSEIDKLEKELLVKSRTTVTHLTLLGKLIIRSNVNGDMVKINGENKGSTRLDLELKAGKYELEVSKSGFHTWKKSVQVKSGSEQIVWANLQKINSVPFTHIFQENLTGMELVKVTSGCFTMGDNNISIRTKPEHKVCITQDYYIGKYEVTQGQWQAIMSNNPSKFKKGDNHPVEQISWNDAQEFILKLSTITNMTYRLPTEAEWEYACRSGGKKQKYCGGNNPSTYAWFGEQWSRGHQPVGSKSPNGLGLYDMSGNISEWINDRFSNYSNNSLVNDPKGPTAGLTRIMRGGAWMNRVERIQLAYRFDNDPSFSSPGLGFRLAMTAKNK